MFMNLAIVLQARVGSTRYPGKALADICGKTLMERVLFRLEQACGGPQVLALPDTAENDPLERMGLARGWRVCRGSEPDVLSRYAKAIRRFELDRVVRATADNPLVDPQIVRRVCELIRDHECVQPVNGPPGSAVEGAAARALLAADRDAQDPFEREHVFPYIYRHPELFPRVTVESEWPRAERYRLTVDTAEDIERTRRVFAALGDAPSREEIIHFYDEVLLK